MVDLSRSAGLTGFLALAQTLGVDGNALAAEAGVPPAALLGPDLKIPTAAVTALLDLAALRSGAEDFGLRLAETRRLSNVGPLALLVHAQPDLRAALNLLHRFQWLIQESLLATLEQSEETTILAFSFSAESAPVSRQVSELTLGAVCAYLKELLGRLWQPQAVLFRHHRPRITTTHRRIFGVMPEFNADMDAIVLAKRDLDTPFAASDPVLVKYMEDYIQRFAAEHGRSMRHTAGEAIVSLMAQGTCRADRVAARLGIDRRTLHRRLAAEDCSYRGLLEEKRREMVLSFLAEGRDLSTIAELVGLASSTGLSHWFRRQFGQSIRTYRANAKR